MLLSTKNSGAPPGLLGFCTAGYEPLQLTIRVFRHGVGFLLNTTLSLDPFVVGRFLCASGCFVPISVTCVT
eukprot:7797950-Ditylum_brightwellii.AAC.1